MGKGKIDIKKIENSTNRQVTFSKRRAGLFKKARELAILCASDVAVIVFSNTGRLFDFSSSSMKRLLERYRSVSGSKDGNNEHQEMFHQLRSLKKENEELHSEFSYMMGEALNTMSTNQLQLLEGNLEAAGKKVRERKMEVLKYEHRKTESKVKGLQQKCAVLRQLVAEVENHQPYGNTRDSTEIHMTSQSPEFRVKPSHPNLQDSEY